MTTYVWDGSTDGDTTTAANWTPAGPPGDTDDVIFPAWASQAVDGNADFPAGSASGVGFKSVVIEEGVTYNIGSRATPLELWMDKDSNTGLNIGGTGTYFISPKDYEQITITEAGSAPADGQYAINITAALLDGTTTGSIHIRCESNQSIGIAAEANTLAEVDELYVFGGDVTVGVGATLNDASAAFPLVISGGILETSCALTTVTQTGGTWTHLAGAITTPVLSGGTLNYNGSGTITTMTIREDGTFDTSEQVDDASFAITNPIEMYSGGTIIDPNKAATAGLVIDLNQCSIDDVNLDLGENLRITRGSVA